MRTVISEHSHVPLSLAVLVTAVISLSCCDTAYSSSDYDAVPIPVAADHGTGTGDSNENFVEPEMSSVKPSDMPASSARYYVTATQVEPHNHLDISHVTPSNVQPTFSAEDMMSEDMETPVDDNIMVPSVIRETYVATEMPPPIEDTTLSENVPETSEPLQDFHNSGEQPENELDAEESEGFGEDEDEESEEFEAEEDEENAELVKEPIPTPMALITSNGEGSNPPLEEEFAEAFRKVGPHGRRRRIRPGGRRRRVRMRVKKAKNRMDQPDDERNLIRQQNDNDIEVIPGTRRGSRYRSTTPTPTTTPNPSTIPNDRTQVIKQGPKPLIITDIHSGSVGINEIDQGTQNEKPHTGGFTEKISTYFFTPPSRISTTNEPKVSNESDQQLDSSMAVESKPVEQKMMSRRRFRSTTTTEAPASSKQETALSKDGLENSMQSPIIENRVYNVRDNTPDFGEFVSTTAMPQFLSSFSEHNNAQSFNNDQQNMASGQQDVSATGFYSPYNRFDNNVPFVTNSQNEMNAAPSFSSNNDPFKQTNEFFNENSPFPVIGKPLSNPSVYDNVMDNQIQGPHFGQSGSGLSTPSPQGDHYFGVPRPEFSQNINPVSSDYGQSTHYTTGEFKSSPLDPTTNMNLLDNNLVNFHGPQLQAQNHILPSGQSFDGTHAEAFPQPQPLQSFPSAADNVVPNHTTYIYPENYSPSFDPNLLNSFPPQQPQSNPDFSSADSSTVLQGEQAYQTGSSPPDIITHNNFDNMEFSVGQSMNAAPNPQPLNSFNVSPDYVVPSVIVGQTTAPNSVQTQNRPEYTLVSGNTNQLTGNTDQDDQNFPVFIAHSPGEPSHSPSYNPSSPEQNINNPDNIGPQQQAQPPLQHPPSHYFGNFQHHHGMLPRPLPQSAPIHPALTQINGNGIASPMGMHFTSPGFPNPNAMSNMPMGFNNIPQPPTNPNFNHPPNFPAHAHSMAAKPDYEPANPPLPIGHPGETNFGQYVPNIFNNGISGGPQIGPPPPPPTTSLSPKENPPSIRPPNDNIPPGFDVISAYRDQPPPTMSGTFGPQHPTSSSDTPSEDSNSEDQMPYQYTISDGGGMDSGSNLYLQSQEQNQDSSPATTSKPPLKQEKNLTAMFSETPYVLMFPQLVPEEAMAPAPPKLMASEVPVVQASSLSSFQMTPDGGPVLGPGLKAVPVHPRQQMYQVLAKTKYEQEMKKYAEKQNRPPSAIFTPYGVLVPIGTSASASMRHEAIVNAASATHPFSHGHHAGRDKQLLNLLLGKNSALGKFYFHKAAGMREGRLKKHFDFKANLEPALDLLAEKLASKVSAVKYLLRGPAKLGFHAFSKHPATSYSEPRPVVHDAPRNYHYSNTISLKLKDILNAASSPPTNPESWKAATEEQEKKVKGEQVDPYLKTELKKLLKERLREILEERDVPNVPKPRPGLFKPGNFMMTSSSNLQRIRVSPPPPSNPKWRNLLSLGHPGMNSGGGLIGTIKKLFSFGTASPRLDTGFGPDFSGYNSSNSHPFGALRGLSKWGFGSVGRMGLPATAGQGGQQHVNNQVKSRSPDSSRKRAKKQLEKWLDMVLKTSEKEKKATRMSPLKFISKTGGKGKSDQEKKSSLAALSLWKKSGSGGSNAHFLSSSWKPIKNVFNSVFNMKSRSATSSKTQ